MPCYAPNALLKKLFMCLGDLFVFFIIFTFRVGKDNNRHPKYYIFACNIP